MKFKLQGNWKKQFDLIAVCVQLNVLFAPQNTSANGRCQKSSIFSLPCWANLPATYQDVSCQCGVYAEFPKEGQYPTKFENTVIILSRILILV